MKKYHNTYRIVGIILLLVIGINAIFAGAAMIFQPDGKALGFPPGLLHYSPFRDFLIPGIFLFLFNGISSVVIAFMGFRKKRRYPKLISLQGIVLLAWILLQMIFLRQVNGLQLTMLILGFSLIVIGRYIDEVAPNDGRHF